MRIETIVPGGAGHIIARTVGQSTAINTKEKSTHSTSSRSAKLIIHFRRLKQQDECMMQPLFSFSERRARHTGELVSYAAHGCLQSHRFPRREIPFSKTTAFLLPLTILTCVKEWLLRFFAYVYIGRHTQNTDGQINIYRWVSIILSKGFWCHLC